MTTPVTSSRQPDLILLHGAAEPAPPLVDRFQRRITYLRLSVTDRCDLRCAYCMPERMTFLPKKEVLSLEELSIGFERLFSVPRRASCIPDVVAYVRTLLLFFAAGTPRLLLMLVALTS